MLYKHLILALLAATVAVARPQDVDALDEEILQLPDEIVDGDGPIGTEAVAQGGDCNKGVGGGDPFKCDTGLVCEKNAASTKYGKCVPKCTTNTDCTNSATNPFPGAPGKCTTSGPDAGLCTYSECATSSTQATCDGTHYCALDTPSGLNKCVTGCGNDKDCTGTNTCQNHQCKPPTSSGCTSDAGCKSSQSNPFPTAPAKCNMGTGACTYSECATSSTQATCDGTHYCALDTPSGLNKCVTGCGNDKDCTGTDTCQNHQCKPPTTTPAKCNAYKKCPAGQYCHHKECKPGCDKKWSKCKPTATTNGICDSKHSCFPVVAKKTGASCRKDKDCDTDYKCVRDHGHDSHCHKAVGDKALCNQKDVLFPDVCKKGFECKRQADKSYKCVKEEHKQHDKYKH